MFSCLFTDITPHNGCITREEAITFLRHKREQVSRSIACLSSDEFNRTILLYEKETAALMLNSYKVELAALSLAISQLVDEPAVAA